jgi:hypothetical protein
MAGSQKRKAALQRGFAEMQPSDFLDFWFFFIKEKEHIESIDRVQMVLRTEFLKKA